MPSPSVLHIPGYTQEEFKHKKASDHYIDPKDRKALIKALAEKGFRQNFETKRSANDRSIRYVSMNSCVRQDEEGNISGADCIPRDITASKKTEKELMVSRQQFKDLFTFSPDAIISTDQEGKTVSRNSGAENVPGYKPEKMPGASITLLTPRVYSIMHMRLINAVKRSKTADRYETKLLRKDESEVYVNLSMFPLRAEDEKVKSASGIVRDISTHHEAVLMKENVTRGLEQKVTERTRGPETAQEQLAKSLKKEKIPGQLKSRFVAPVSHQSRKSLTVIQSSLGVSDMQKNEMGNDFIPKFDHVYKRISSQVNRMTDLMNAVLIPGKINSGSIKPELNMIAITTLVNTICKSYDDIQPDVRKLICEINGTPRAVIPDKKLFGHALSNLISNAFKYPQYKPAPKLEMNPCLNELKVSLMDYGIGIPQEDMKHLFDPFHRTSNISEIAGTGPGLSITRAYIELDNGVISVESSSNNSTKFTIKFNPSR